MAGVTDEVDLEDLMGIITFLVAMGRVPAAAEWVEGYAARARSQGNEGFAESFF
jgi:hypothetical protein